MSRHPIPDSLQPPEWRFGPKHTTDTGGAAGQHSLHRFISFLYKELIYSTSMGLFKLIPIDVILNSV